MEITATHAIYFSPARSTRKVVSAVASGIAENVTQHDITQGIKNPIELSQGDVAVVGVPSYSGRVPELAAQHLSSINGNGAYAILVCVYGNRDYEDTLLELKAICTERGFKVVSAAAFIARHCIFPMVAEARPDEADLAAARQFGQKSVAACSASCTANLTVKGNFPYRTIKSVPLAPKASKKCNKCGTCAACCPTAAIDAETPRKTNKDKCIACARCIELCPQKARSFSGLLYKLVSKKFLKKCGERKEVECFFAS